jgi:hypothetical protein
MMQTNTANGMDMPMAHSGAGGTEFLVVELAVFVLVVASLWRVFSKAGQPGWACFIPFFNLYVLIKVAGKPGWWLLLFLIPLVDVIIYIIVVAGVAQKFGKGVGFTIGLLLLPMIFYPILAFGDATYGGATA